jgi:hypothetical protein
VRFVRRLLPSEDIDALLGDIAEEARHRSHFWYWAQILAVVVVGSGRVVRHHPWLAGRAIVVGVASLAAYFYGLRTILGGFTYLNSGFFVGSHWIHWSPHWESDRLAIELLFVAMLCLSIFGVAASGWIVGRLHRAHGIAMTGCFAAFIALLSGIVTIRATLTSAWTPSGLIRVALDIAVLAVGPTMIVAGGFWSTRRAEPTK